MTNISETIIRKQDAYNYERAKSYICSLDEFIQILKGIKLNYQRPSLDDEDGYEYSVQFHFCEKFLERTIEFKITFINDNLQDGLAIFIQRFNNGKKSRKVVSEIQRFFNTMIEQLDF